MKTRHLLAAAICCTSLAAQAQHAIKWTPTNYLFTRTATLTYEYAFSHNRSLNTGFNLWLLEASASTASGSEGDASYYAIGLAPEYRFYLGKQPQAPRGFYAAPYLNINFGALKVKVTNDANQTGSGKVNTSILAGGGIIGYQFLFGDAFVLDIFGGLNYTNFSLGNIKVTYEDGTQEEADISGVRIGGILPRFGISIGYAF